MSRRSRGASDDDDDAYSPGYDDTDATTATGAAAAVDDDVPYKYVYTWFCMVPRAACIALAVALQVDYTSETCFTLEHSAHSNLSPVWNIRGKAPVHSGPTLKLPSFNCVLSCTARSTLRLDTTTKSHMERHALHHAPTYAASAVTVASLPHPSLPLPLLPTAVPWRGRLTSTPFSRCCSHSTRCLRHRRRQTLLHRRGTRQPSHTTPMRLDTTSRIEMGKMSHKAIDT